MIADQILLWSVRNRSQQYPTIKIMVYRKLSANLKLSQQFVLMNTVIQQEPNFGKEITGACPDENRETHYPR